MNSPDHRKAEPRAIRYDQHGTPDRKLPLCPWCGGDGLWAQRGRERVTVGCGCGWCFNFERDREARSG